MGPQTGNAPAVPGISVSHSSPEYTMEIVKAVVHDLPPQTEKPRVMVGSDRSVAGMCLAGVAKWALALAGACVWWLGHLPLPAISWLAAFHQDDENGGVDGVVYLHCAEGLPGQAWLVPLGPSGAPYSRRRCSEIAVAAQKPTSWPPIWRAGAVEEKKRLGSAYQKELAAASRPKLREALVLVNAQNWTVSDIVPLVLHARGVLPVPLNYRVNGANAGSCDLEWLSAEVLRTRARGAVSINSEGTRIRVLDKRGMPVSEDKLLAFFARRLVSGRGLMNRALLGPSPMSHELEETLDSLQCRFVPLSASCPDLAAEMRERGAMLAGDSTGRFAFAERGMVPDGCYAAIEAAAMLASSP